MKNIRGEYTYQVLDKLGVPIQKPIKVENLILDSLKTIQNNRFASVVLQIGSGGNTPPSPSDTSLVNRIASSSAQNFTEQVGSRVRDTDYITIRWYRSFSITGVSGLISELGLSKGGTLFTRSLITDSEGNPTEIELESDQTLQVNYSIYVRYKRHIKDITIETPHGDIEGYLGVRPGFNFISNSPLLVNYERYFGIQTTNSTGYIQYATLYLTRVSNNAVQTITRDSEVIDGNGNIKFTFKVPPVAYDRYIGDVSSGTYKNYIIALAESHSRNPGYGIFLKEDSVPVIIPANHNFDFEITFVIGILED